MSYANACHYAKLDLYYKTARRFRFRIDGYPDGATSLWPIWYLIKGTLNGACLAFFAFASPTLICMALNEKCNAFNTIFMDIKPRYYPACCSYWYYDGLIRVRHYAV